MLSVYFLLLYVQTFLHIIVLYIYISLLSILTGIRIGIHQTLPLSINKIIGRHMSACRIQKAIRYHSVKRIPQTIRVIIACLEAILFFGNGTFSDHFANTLTTLTTDVNRAADVPSEAVLKYECHKLR